MKALVLGGGGREHALAWRLARDSSISEVFCAPGNAGTAQVATNVAFDPANPGDVVSFIQSHDVTLTVVGPELPLTRGVVDEVRARNAGFVFGPTKAAAEIESSKVFAKQFMRRYHVPTADYEVFDDAERARAVVRSGRFGFPLVLKADGLAAGKGVIIAPDAQTALDAVDTVMVARQFGQAGDRLLIEECLEGPEVSVFVVADGTRATPFHTAQDHKRAYDNDEGPNTGGMGAFAPSPLVDDALAKRIHDEIVAPTIEGMRVEGRPFCGFLYAGLMLTAEGPKVLEFNARLGDPEAQVVLPMLGEDLAPLLLDAAAGNLNSSSCRFLGGARVGVVVVSGGYPGDYAKGKPIGGLDRASSDPDVVVFHSGTAARDGSVVTAGGRVLTVVGAGADYQSAMARAYDGVKKISFEGMRYRGDIGKKAIVRSR